MQIHRLKHYFEIVFQFIKVLILYHSSVCLIQFFARALSYDYLGLNMIADQRLKLKANIMKKAIYLCQQWREGNDGDWIDRIANRTCVSTRKIREDYINPLVTEDVLERAGNGTSRFVGLPSGVGQEISERQMKEEWEEENAKRRELNKPEISYKEWVETRSKRFRPLNGSH